MVVLDLYQELRHLFSYYQFAQENSESELNPVP